MKRKINVFVIIISVLSILSSLVGVFYQYDSNITEVVSVNGAQVELYQHGLYYRDSVSVAAQGIASDIVTALFAIPILLVSLVLYNKEQLKGKVLLTGIIGYFMYTYISYVFLWNYNFMFLIYVSLMSLSTLTFILLMSSYDYKNFKQSFSKEFSTKYVGIFQILIGVFIGLMWLGTIVTPLLSNKTPEILEHYTTLVIQAMDLGIVVPTAITSGILILKKDNLGYILSSVVIVKGSMMLIAILTMIVNQTFAGVTLDIVVTTVFGLFAVASIAALIFLLRGISSENINHV